jgi:hypothetical protein
MALGSERPFIMDPRAVESRRDPAPSTLGDVQTLLVQVLAEIVDGVLHSLDLLGILV